MEDQEIVALFFARDEAAIREVKERYGSYCLSVIRRVLDNEEDAEETLNDTWLHAWAAIPPQRPTQLRPFLAKIARNLAIDCWRRNTAQKREGQFMTALEELGDCVGSEDTQQAEAEAEELEAAIRSFLSARPERERDVFLRRYFFFDTTEEIARRYRMRESNVLNILSRTRKKLKIYLKEEGFNL